MSKKTLKAGTGYIIGNYLLKGFAFITVPIFARLLTVSDYGIFSTFVAYETILSILISFAIHSSYKNAYYKFGVEQKAGGSGITYYNYATNSLVLILGSEAVWIAIAFIFRKNVEELIGLDLRLQLLLIVYSTSTALLLCFNTDRGIRYEYKEYLAMAGANAVTNFLLSLFLIFCVFSNEKYMGRIIGTTVPMILIGLTVIYLFFRKARPKNLSESLKWGLRYSLPIVPHGISQVVLNQFDRIMIKNMIGNIEAGYYSFAYSVYSIVSVTFTSLDTVWSPWFYEQMTAGNHRAIRKASSIYCAIVCSFCVSVILGSPEVIYILGGDKYAETTKCVIPIVGSGFFLFLYYFPAGVEYFYEKTRYIAAGSILAALINIILNYILLKRYGYIAAAYTTLAAYVLYFAFHYSIYYRICSEQLFSNRVIGLSIVAIFCAQALTLALLREIWIRWVVIIVILVSVLIALEKQLLISEEIRKIIKKGD